MCIPLLQSHEEAVYGLQRSLNQCLSGFLYFRPVLRRNIVRQWRRYMFPATSTMRRVGELAVELKAAPLPDSLTIALRHRHVSSRELAQLIAYGYTVLADHMPLPPGEILRTAHRENSQSDVNGISSSARSLMSSFRATAADSDVMCAFAHGSLGSGDSIDGYSDADFLVVLRRETVCSEEGLFELLWRVSRLLGDILCYDPLQHHGLFVLTELDLGSYPVEYFPPVLLNFATPVFLAEDVGQLSLNARVDRAELLASFDALCEGAMRLSCESSMRSAYNIKALASTVLLVPIFFRQAKYHEFNFKPEGLRKARQEAPPEVWDVIDRITHLRDHWRYRSKLPPSLIRGVSATLGPLITQSVLRFESAVRVREARVIVGNDFGQACRRLVRYYVDKRREIAAGGARGGYCAGPA